MARQVGDASEGGVLPQRELVVAVPMRCDDLGAVVVPQHAAYLRLGVDAVQRVGLDDGEVGLDRGRVAAGERRVDVREVAVRVLVELTRVVEEVDGSRDRCCDWGIDVPETERLVGRASARCENSSPHRIPRQPLDGSDVATQLHQRSAVLDRG